MQMHRIAAFKANIAQSAVPLLQGSTPVTFSPVICRNAQIQPQPCTDEGNIPFRNLSDALCCPSVSNAVGHNRTGLDIRSEGILVLDLAQDSVGTALQESHASNKHANSAAQRLQALKEVVALNWQSSPLLPSTDDDILHRNTGAAPELLAAAALIVRLASVCAANSLMTLENALELLTAEKSMLVRFLVTPTANRPFSKHRCKRSTQNDNLDSLLRIVFSQVFL
jgi:hypothetical protein